MAGREARWGFVLAALVVLGAAVGGAVVLTGDGGGGGPEQVVRDYITAEANGDCERLLDLLSARIVEEGGGRREMLDDCADARDDAEEVADGELAALVDTIETTGVDGDRATVTYTGGAEATQQVTVEVTLVDEGGDWKVEDVVPVTGDLPEGSPVAAARDHGQAILDGDCDAFLAVLSTGALADLGDTPGERSSACEQRVGSGPSAADSRLGPVMQDSEGDGTAVVGVTVFSPSYEAGNTIFYVAVVEEGGEWKVDQVGWSDFPEETAD